MQDLAKKRKSQLCTEIKVSVVDDTPLRKRHFCNDAHRDTTKIARSHGEYRHLREVCHCQHRGRQTQASGLTMLAYNLEFAKLRPRTCQVQVQNLSSSGPELVTFEPEACHVRAWNLPSPIMALVRFDPATCPVRAHPDRPRVHAHSELSCVN